MPLGGKKGDKRTPEEDEILNRQQSQKIQKRHDEKEKSAKNQSSSRGAVPTGLASCVPRSMTRLTRSNRWLRAGGPGAGVLSEESQGPEREGKKVIVQ